MIYKQCVTLCNPKMYPQNKLGIPTANSIGDVLGIPTSKQNKIYALDTIFLELRSEDKVKITVTQKQYANFCDPKVYSHTKFGIPVANYITDMFRSQFRFRLMDGEIVSCVSSLH